MAVSHGKCVLPKALFLIICLTVYERISAHLAFLALEHSTFSLPIRFSSSQSSAGEGLFRIECVRQNRVLLHRETERGTDCVLDFKVSSFSRTFSSFSALL